MARSSHSKRILGIAESRIDQRDVVRGDVAFLRQLEHAIELRERCCAPPR